MANGNGVGDKIRSGLYIPGWALALIITIALAFTTFSIGAISNSASYHKQVDVNVQEVQELKDITKELDKSKVDKETIIEIKQDIKDIKNLLQRHMSKDQ